jgi:hypothetical protein
MTYSIHPVRGNIPSVEAIGEANVSDKSTQNGQEVIARLSRSPSGIMGLLMALTNQRAMPIDTYGKVLWYIGDCIILFPFPSEEMEEATRLYIPEAKRFLERADALNFGTDRANSLAKRKSMQDIAMSCSEIKKLLSLWAPTYREDEDKLFLQRFKVKFEKISQ